jgi:hypothetical protein
MILMAVLQSISVLQDEVFAFMQFPNGSVAGMALMSAPDLTNYSMGDELETQYSEFGDVHIMEKLSRVSSHLKVGEVADKVVSTVFYPIQFCAFYIMRIWKMELVVNVVCIDCRYPILRC